MEYNSECLKKKISSFDLAEWPKQFHFQKYFVSVSIPFQKSLYCSPIVYKISKKKKVVKIIKYKNNVMINIFSREQGGQHRPPTSQVGVLYTIN